MLDRVIALSTAGEHGKGKDSSSRRVSYDWFGSMNSSEDGWLSVAGSTTGSVYFWIYLFSPWNYIRPLYLSK